MNIFATPQEGRKFNQAQIEAMTHKDGPMMVLAGPGSGKTTVITHRVRYLIEQAGVDPSSILVVTFTKAAAAEMKSRFLQLMGRDTMPVGFGTFHSIFFTILKHAYNFQAADIVTEGRKMEIFREIVNEAGLELEDEADFINGIASEISLVKGELISLEHYYSVNCGEDVFRKIYSAYQNRLKAARLIDFDDMLVYTWELFSARPDILGAWQKKFRYILIDEFQDINRLQYEIIRMLAAPEDNLFTVGDDDQSIYKFRGAKPEIMLNFAKDYPNSRQILLDMNYRCTQQIVEGALRVIKNNKKRYEKDLKASHRGGEPVCVKSFLDVREENEAVVSEILLKHEKEGLKFSEMAVLYRTNTGSRQLLTRLMEYNIPFRMKDNIPNLFEHWIARDILSYIRVAKGIGGRSDFLRIINRPKRYISRQCLEAYPLTIESIRDKCGDREWMIQRVDRLAYDLNALREMTPFAAVNYIRYAIGYETYLDAYAKMRRLKLEDLLELVNELSENAREYETFEAWKAYIDNYGQSLKQQARRKDAKAVDSVVLSTMHSAKGLEYDTVFIIDANEGVVPHKKAVMAEDLEEERRMFYVAMTRAKSHLHIYFTKERYKKPVEMSRFVGEFLVDRDVFKVGQRLRHETYGEGVITKLTDRGVTILFDQSKEIKTLNINFCISRNLLRLV